MAETFEVYRARILSYLGDEERIGVQEAAHLEVVSTPAAVARSAMSE